MRRGISFRVTLWVIVREPSKSTSLWYFLVMKTSFFRLSFSTKLLIHLFLYRWLFEAAQLAVDVSASLIVSLGARWTWRGRFMDIHIRFAIWIISVQLALPLARYLDQSKHLDAAQWWRMDVVLWKSAEPNSLDKAFWQPCGGEEKLVAGALWRRWWCGWANHLGLVGAVVKVPNQPHNYYNIVSWASRVKQIGFELRLALLIFEIARNWRHLLRGIWP